MRRDVEREIADRQRYTYDKLRERRRLDAADRVEELAAIAKALVTDLRGQPGESGQQAANDTAYGRVYWLRRELGRVVATLGIGLPEPWVLRVVDREYGADAGWSDKVSREGERSE